MSSKRSENGLVSDIVKNRKFFRNCDNHDDTGKNYSIHLIEISNVLQLHYKNPSNSIVASLLEFTSISEIAVNSRKSETA